MLTTFVLCQSVLIFTPFTDIVDGFVDETRSTPKVIIIILELAYLS
jgi:hypothetical protein